MNQIRKITPFVRRIPLRGGAFYTFSSASEDLGLNLNESVSHNFRFSKFALLNIPPILNRRAENTLKLDAPAGAHKNISFESSTDYNLHFIQSFQNYCLNLETMLISDEGYDASLAKSISERVFFKWLKEICGIRFNEKHLNGLESTRYVEESNQQDLYNRVVKYIGEVNVSGNVSNKDNTYTEVYLHIPVDAGNTPDVLFKNYEDINYYPGKAICRTTDGLDNEIISGRQNDNIHPDGLDIRAMYDNDSGFLEVTEFQDYFTSTGMKLFKHKGNSSTYNIDVDSEEDSDYEYNSWWYEHTANANCYYLDEEFTNPGNDHLAIYSGSTGDINEGATKFVRSRLDGIEIDFDIENYRNISELNNINSFYDLNTSVLSKDFDFNAVLLYYDVYENETYLDDDTVEQNRANVLATNLFGVLFLDRVTSLSEGGGEIKSFTKFRSNDDLLMNGNEFGFKINFLLGNDGTFSIKHSLIAEDNTIALGMYLDTLQEMMDLSETMSGVQRSILAMTDKIRFLEDIKYQNQNLNNLFNRLHDIENLLNNQNEYLNVSLVQNPNSESFIYLTEINQKLNNLLNNRTNINVAFDLGTLRQGQGTRLERTADSVIIHTDSNYFKYGGNPVLKSSDFVKMIGKNSREIFLTYEASLYDGNNYLRIEDDNGNPFHSENDIFIYIKDDKFRWQEGKMFRIYFGSPYILKKNNTFKTLSIFTDYHNVLNKKENFSKLILKIDGGLHPFTTKNNQPTIDIHCHNPKNLEFFVDYN